MRKLFALLSFTTAAYCSSAQNIDTIIQQLNGCWRWDHYFGGFPGLPPTPATRNVYTEFFRDGADSLAGNTISTRVYEDTVLEFSGRCNVTEHPTSDYFLLSCPLFDSVDVAGSPPVYFNFEGDTLLFPQQEFVDGFVDGFLKTCGDTITGVENPKELTVNVYPNPASGQFVIDFKNAQPLQIELYNAVGKKVTGFELKNKSSATLDASAFPEGVYFITMRTKEGMITRKILLAR